MNSTYSNYQSVEYIYDKYSPVMYGIALQISSGEKDAEQILTAAFQKIHKLKLFRQNNSCTCVKLIKFTIETARELFPKYKRNYLELKQFKQSPVLNQILCENMGIKSLPGQNILTRSQLMKSLQVELSLFLKARKEYLVRTIVIPEEVSMTSSLKYGHWDYQMRRYCG